jgi:hypothetical protein
MRLGCSWALALFLYTIASAKAQLQTHERMFGKARAKILYLNKLGINICKTIISTL